MQIHCVCILVVITIWTAQSYFIQRTTQKSHMHSATDMGRRVKSSLRIQKSLTATPGEKIDSAIESLSTTKNKYVEMISNTEDSLKKYNIPNMLSIGRVLAVPLFMASFLAGWTVASFVIYIIACLTDFLDGFLARRWNQMSAFGAFVDPVADKLMVATALIMLSARFPTMLYIFPVSLIMFREIGVSALREWMAERSLRNVVQVGKMGKYKTAFQMIATALLLIVIPDNSPGLDLCITWGFSKPLVFITGMAMLYLSTFLTLVSGASYLNAAWPTLTNPEIDANAAAPNLGDPSTASSNLSSTTSGDSHSSSSSASSSNTANPAAGNDNTTTNSSTTASSSRSTGASASSNSSSNSADSAPPFYGDDNILQ
mmetsp:Transcript_20043/g.33546  ORF Transcript_20043/g.33546 Transcript_20043/m.33546 type:complete len:372 (-) Transcript_20043:269-1384(-)